MRRLLPLAAAAASLAAAAAATAAVVHAPAGGGLVAGTSRADTLLGGKGADAVDAAFGGRDVVRCGAGRDVVDADLGDRVARDCEIVARRLSVDATTAARAQHETAVEPSSAAWGPTVVAAFQLGRIAQGAAALVGTAVSSDAGRTWRRATLPSLTLASSPPGTQLAASDPSVAYDAVHAVWLVGALTVESGGTQVVVSRSGDGLHWSAPVGVAAGPVLDKDWFACDNGAASPRRGRCYATYTDDDRNETVVQHSDDGGQTWSEPVAASSTLVGTQPVVQPDGTLVVVAGDYRDETGSSGTIVSLVSHDGGDTFARSTVAPLHAATAGPLRAPALPSATGDAAGTLYAVWHDCGRRPSCTGNDLVLATSRDGATWTQPARVPATVAGRVADAFLPGLTADPARPGRLGLVYADWQPGSCPGNCLLGIGFVTSADGGATWSASQPLSTRPIRPGWLARTDGGRMIGDYLSTSVAGGRFVPVFTLAGEPSGTRLREAIFAASLGDAAGRRR